MWSHSTGTVSLLNGGQGVAPGSIGAARVVNPGKCGIEAILIHIPLVQHPSRKKETLIWSGCGNTVSLPYGRQGVAPGGVGAARMVNSGNSGIKATLLHIPQVRIVTHLIQK